VAHENEDTLIEENLMTMRKFTHILILLLLTFQAAVAQQPGEVSFHDESVMPAGIKGARIEAVITTVNANDPDRVREFLEKHCTERFRKFAPMDQHIDVFLGLYQETGGMEFHSIRTYVPERKGETVVILKDRNFGSWRAFVMRLDEKNDSLISGLNFAIARTPSNVQEPALNEELCLKNIKDMMEGLIKKNVFSGTFLIAKGDEILMTFVGGEASKRFHVPNNLDTKFNLGSMNKMFTATSIMQLVEKGRLSLDDPIGKYVDESWLPEEITSKITIHHLLTHTSGLGSYFNETYMNGSRELFRYVDDFKPLVNGEKPAFEPGKRFQYSNTGMLLLWVVIESVTGGSYFDYIRKNIYEPAGMTDSDSYEMDYPVENLAIGYSRDRNSPYGWQNNLYKHVIKGGPAGGGFATVKDLHRFARAIQTGKLVSQESLNKMWKDYAGANYGYGFTIEEGPNGKVVGHGGGFDGINSNLDIYLDKGYIVAVMSNYDNGASPIAQKIGQILARVR
jgi:CubicO group peptidase (beta-lactamase class C family)